MSHYRASVPSVSNPRAPTSHVASLVDCKVPIYRLKVFAILGSEHSIHWDLNDDVVIGPHVDFLAALQADSSALRIFRVLTFHYPVPPVKVCRTGKSNYTYIHRRLTTKVHMHTLNDDIVLGPYIDFLAAFQPNGGTLRVVHVLTFQHTLLAIEVCCTDESNDAHGPRNLRKPRERTRTQRWIFLDAQTVRGKFVGCQRAAPQAREQTHGSRESHHRHLTEWRTRRVDSGDIDVNQKIHVWLEIATCK
mmetsp:Transcript_31105/g.49969  ORF Transcript_31105/g.49969 Transcript_31105/m.49969 type:complete len:248 (-) Transcript_31105:88-831(-)